MLVSKMQRQSLPAALCEAVSADAAAAAAPADTWTRCCCEDGIDGSVGGLSLLGGRSVGGLDGCWLQVLAAAADAAAVAAARTDLLSVTSAEDEALRTDST